MVRTVWRARVKRCCLGLRHLLHLAIYERIRINKSRMLTVAHHVDQRSVLLLFLYCRK